MSSLIVCRILASNYQANNHYNRAGAKCPIFLVMYTAGSAGSYVFAVHNLQISSKTHLQNYGYRISAFLSVSKNFPGKEKGGAR